MVETTSEALIKASILCSIPMCLMYLGSLTVFCRAPEPVFVQMTQHLGAGIVLSAVATELLPQILNTPTHLTKDYCLSILIGFFLGVGLMVTLEKFCGHEEEEEGEEKEQQQEEDDDERNLLRVRSLNPPHAVQSDISKSPYTLMMGYRQSFNRAEKVIASSSKSLGSEKDNSFRMVRMSTMETFYEANKKKQQEQGLPALATTLPIALIVAVYVDSLMDGFLIGISAVSGETAGIVMTVALSIEMFFLGLTFVASLASAPKSLRYPIVAGAPLMIMVGGLVGSAAASALLSNPVLQVGLISFGMAALLYLVTEELLVEAHEDSSEHIWYVDLMFFVGFIASVILERHTKSQPSSTTINTFTNILPPPPL